MKPIGITQRLKNRVRQRGNMQQFIAAWEGRVRAWSRRTPSSRPAAGVPSSGADTSNPTTQQDADSAKPQGQPVLRRIRRNEQSLEQLYDAVDQAHIVWLDQFHNFLDAKDVLCEARQAMRDDGEPLLEAAAQPMGVSSVAVNAPDVDMDVDGWDEDALGGAWGGESNG